MTLISGIKRWLRYAQYAFARRIFWLTGVEYYLRNRFELRYLDRTHGLDDKPVPTERSLAQATLPGSGSAIHDVNLIADHIFDMRETLNVLRAHVEILDEQMARYSLPYASMRTDVTALANRLVRLEEISASVSPQSAGGVPAAKADRAAGQARPAEPEPTM